MTAAARIAAVRTTSLVQNLKPAFRIAAASHNRNSLKITWGDSTSSHFPNIWLRSSVRDEKFFNSESCLYRDKHEYLKFTAQENPLVSIDYVKDEDELTLHWKDHSSTFNVSWLKAQDHQNFPELSKEDTPVLWTGKDTDLPVAYNYSERKESFDTWFNVLRNYGFVYFEGVPRSEKGLEDVLHLIGLRQQRYHPIDSIPLAHNLDTNSKTHKDFFTSNYDTDKHDKDVYGADFHPFHTDYAAYKLIRRISGLLCVEYEAPVQDTENYFTDSIKIMQDIKEEDPVAYDLLKTVPVKIARRRLTTPHKCPPEDVYKYQLDLFKNEPLFFHDDEENLPSLVYTTKFSGFELSRDIDAETMRRYNKAHQLLHKKLLDPYYQYKCVLRPGCLAVFNNYRVAHARSSIHPSTKRSILVGFVGEEIWHARSRINLGNKSQLEDRWLYGCSKPALRMLANRFEN